MYNKNARKRQSSQKLENRMENLNFFDVLENQYSGVRETVFESKNKKNFVANFRPFLEKVLASESEGRLESQFVQWVRTFSECKFRHVREGALEIVQLLVEAQVASAQVHEILARRTKDLRKNIRSKAFQILLLMVERQFTEGLPEVCALARQHLESLELVRFVQQLSQTDSREFVLLEFCELILQLCFSDSQQV